MKILVNGEALQLSDTANIQDLIEHLDCQEKRIAVEVNEMIIPKSKHQEFLLSHSDKVEIINAVGGG